jgi:hypothetical protein
MKTYIYPLLGLAWFGFVLSFLVHITARAGVALPQQIIILHIGVFVVWIPALRINKQSTASSPTQWSRRMRRRQLFDGCPTWMGWVAGGLGAYAVINFLLLAAPKLSPARGLALFSGAWMFFYFMAVVILFPAAQTAAPAQPQVCPHGETISSSGDGCVLCQVWGPGDQNL